MVDEAREMLLRALGWTDTVSGGPDVYTHTLAAETPPCPLCKTLMPAADHRLFEVRSNEGCVFRLVARCHGRYVPWVI